MYGSNEGPKLEAGEIGQVSEAFLVAFTKKCQEKFGTASGINYTLNGRPLRAYIAKRESDGTSPSPSTREAVQRIATEILSTYELDAVGLEAIFDADSYDEPTIIIQYKEM
jgi:hypothetical protein